MSKVPFRLELLEASHDRSTFNCGTPALDRYFREPVCQDMRRRVATCFVALSGDQRIAGYYTLASACVPLTELPPETCVIT